MGKSRQKVMPFRFVIYVITRMVGTGIRFSQAQDPTKYFQKTFELHLSSYQVV